MNNPLTEADWQLARDAIITGWKNCPWTNAIGLSAKPCDCDQAAVDGCEARVGAVAQAISQQRRWAEDEQSKRHKAEEDRLELRAALQAIERLVHVPTPTGTKAYTHFMRDFDQIRLLCRAAIAKATGDA